MPCLLGGYFLRHARGEARQTFVSCSDDLRQLVLCASYYDRKTGREVYPISDIVSIASDVPLDGAEGPS